MRFFFVSRSSRSEVLQKMSVRKISEISNDILGGDLLNEFHATSNVEEPLNKVNETKTGENKHFIKNSWPLNQSNCSQLFYKKKLFWKFVQRRSLFLQKL